MPSDKQTLDQLRIDRTTTPRRKSRAGLVAWIVVALIVGVAAWWWFQRTPAVVVKTTNARTVAAGGVTTLLNASGYVTARRAATVSSKVTGRVTEVLIEEGMSVTEGQVLAHVDASNVQTNLRLAEAQLASARSGLGETEANLELARRELKRTQSLIEAKGVSVSELDRTQFEVDALAARLARQRADITVSERQVALWQQQFDDTIIRAPFSGIVVSKNAQPGEMISPISAGGGFTRTGICTIVDMESLEVEVDVNESYINRVAAGQPVAVTLDSYPDWSIPSRVIAIIPTADRQKATVRVRVGFEKLDPRILPDMGLKVAFQKEAGDDTPARRSVIVPQEALRRVDGRDIVWIVRDGKIERRAVTIAATNVKEVTLAAGLEGGEKIVVEGPTDLAEGMPVKEAQP